MVIIITCLSLWYGSGTAFFFKSGLNRRSPWHHMWHVTLVCYGWEAGYTIYTQCLVGPKRNQKLRVVMVLRNPSCPLPCLPPCFCLLSPSHLLWTWQSWRWQAQLSVPQNRQKFLAGGIRTRTPQQGPSTSWGRERGHVSLPCPANSWIHLSGLFSFTPLPRRISCSSSNFQVSQTEITFHRKRQSSLTQWSH